MRIAHSLPVNRPRQVAARRPKLFRAWFSRLWASRLEKNSEGGRFVRGRRYFQEKRISALRWQGQKVTARVKGSRPRPYRVEVECRTDGLTFEDILMQRLSKSPQMVQEILRGELPEALEHQLRSEQISLVPGLKDLACYCNCPDGANLCKHSVAVILEMLRQLEDEPLRLLEFQGVSMDAWMRRLQLSPLQKRLRRLLETPAPEINQCDSHYFASLRTTQLPPMFPETRSWPSAPPLPEIPELPSPPPPAKDECPPFWNGDISLQELLEMLQVQVQRNQE
jgi:uncharacterized Zn finger protein